MNTNEIEAYSNNFFDIGIDTYFKNFPFEIPRHIEPINDQIINKYFSELFVEINKDFNSFKKDNPRLNIWKEIGLGDSELKHCTFLTWLLDPNGSHYQRELFLKCFFNHIEQLRHLSVDLKPDFIQVNKEFSYGESGRVDIKIKSQYFLLIIEAKINAGEQDKQLDRYRKELEIEAQRYRIDDFNRHIIFLTRDGRPPNTDVPVICIKWRDLTKACAAFAKDCKNQLLKQLVQQYHDFLKTLI